MEKSLQNELRESGKTCVELPFFLWKSSDFGGGGERVKGNYEENEA